MKEIFGLDFGTVNSALAVNVGGSIELVNIDKFNNSGKTLKSVIYFDPEEKKFYVGQQAVNHYIDNDAWGRYVQSAKTFLSDKSFEYTEIGGKIYKLDQLIAIILKNIKEKGQEYLGKELNRVVLGRPVVFSTDIEREKLAVERLLSAARIAGFEDVHLQYEPIAAALAFESTLPQDEEKIILVGDFGGGTSDFTVVRARGGRHQKRNDRKSDILGLSGVYVGGDDFDSSLMWNKVAYYFGKDVRVRALMSDFDLPVSSMILNNLKKWHLIPQLRLPSTTNLLREIKYQADKPDLIENLEKLVEENYGYMLFQLIEKVKCELSSLPTSVINLNELFLKIKEDVSRDEFENFIAADIEKIEVCIEEAIYQAGIAYEDVDVVFLTGGSSHVPIIKRIFSEKFGGEKINQTNAFTSVACGLGISGNLYID